MLGSTAEQCQTAALEKLEADAKLRRQNFGNQSDSSPKSSVSPAAAPPLQDKGEPDAALLRKGTVLLDRR